jgi:hypothetical protein
MHEPTKASEAGESTFQWLHMLKRKSTASAIKCFSAEAVFSAVEKPKLLKSLAKEVRW